MRLSLHVNGREVWKNEELGMRNGGGGAQIGKRRLMKYDSGSAAPFDTTHTRHFERWQWNWSHSSEHDLKERSDAQIIVSR